MLPLKHKLQADDKFCDISSKWSMIFQSLLTLTHLSQMDFPISTNWVSPFPF